MANADHADLAICSVQATLVTISQWRWGSRTPKPTTLLAIRLPLLRASMDRWQIAGLSKPEACAMGLHDGVFRTEEMKTYSEALSGAFAQGIFDGLKRAPSLWRSSLGLLCWNR